MGKKHFGFFHTAETGKRTPNSGVKGSGVNHYPRAPGNQPSIIKREKKLSAKTMLVAVSQRYPVVFANIGLKTNVRLDFLIPENNKIDLFLIYVSTLCSCKIIHKYVCFNLFVTSPGDLRDLGRLFRYEARRSPGLIP